MRNLAFKQTGFSKPFLSALPARPDGSPSRSGSLHHSRRLSGLRAINVNRTVDDLEEIDLIVNLVVNSRRRSNSHQNDHHDLFSRPPTARQISVGLRRHTTTV
jgi:hypothetical protein